MATAEVDVCNRALLRIGHKRPITDLGVGDASEAAVLCGVLYPQARDEVLAAFPWPFAVKVSGAMAPLSTVRPGWTYMYSAPADMLQALYIYNGKRPGAPIASLSAVVSPVVADYTGIPYAGVGRKIPYTIEANDSLTGRVLLTDQPSANLVYIARVQQVVAFPPLFVDCLAWKIASELAFALPVRAAMAEYADKKYQMTFAQAAAQAFREEVEDPMADSDSISVRG